MVLVGFVCRHPPCPCIVSCLTYRVGMLLRYLVVAAGSVTGFDARRRHRRLNFQFRSV